MLNLFTLPADPVRLLSTCMQFARRNRRSAIISRIDNQMIRLENKIPRLADANSAVGDRKNPHQDTPEDLAPDSEKNDAKKAP